MSKGAWKRCPWTGISLAKLQRSDAPVTDEGYFDRSSLADCDVFNISSIAALSGFLDVRYFQDHVLPTPDCPIHIRRMVLGDDERPRRNGVIYATRTTSAVAGGQMWWSRQRAAAQARISGGLSDVSSASIIS